MISSTDFEASPPSTEEDDSVEPLVVTMWESSADLENTVADAELVRVVAKVLDLAAAVDGWEKEPVRGMVLPSLEDGWYLPERRMNYNVKIILIKHRQNAYLNFY